MFYATGGGALNNAPADGAAAPGLNGTPLATTVATPVVSERFSEFVRTTLVSQSRDREGAVVGGSAIDVSRGPSYHRSLTVAALFVARTYT